MSKRSHSRVSLYYDERAANRKASLKKRSEGVMRKLYEMERLTGAQSYLVILPDEADASPPLLYASDGNLQRGLSDYLCAVEQLQDLQRGSNAMGLVAQKHKTMLQAKSRLDIKNRWYKDDPPAKRRKGPLVGEDDIAHVQLDEGEEQGNTAAAATNAAASMLLGMHSDHDEAFLPLTGPASSTLWGATE